MREQPQRATNQSRNSHAWRDILSMQGVRRPEANSNHVFFARLDRTPTRL
jgi:hypothetical protein